MLLISDLSRRRVCMSVRVGKKKYTHLINFFCCLCLHIKWNLSEVCILYNKITYSHYTTLYEWNLLKKKPKQIVNYEIPNISITVFVWILHLVDICLFKSVPRTFSILYFFSEKYSKCVLARIKTPAISLNELYE